ncbi:carnosine N-methyltransferase-like isoform X3 [Gigantopelta aegis]|uniref:carnosine N-methyltransferase-like isoform X2 n=1 Tax=Gigantopelta aegis TaxID=1735272 RepID=UPI001B88C299|nr:carnosine N-methyltransferase-like isoform X2 [Gigantopelta aegis]XP_041355852.1 carnosine N-methyltransferase-like isoform X3 [Gigantopelta aegis]
MDDKEVNSDEERQEREHFIRIINAFRFYRTHSLKRVKNAEKYFSELPEEHQSMVPTFLENLRLLRTCIDHNYEVIKLILKDSDCMFENKNHGLPEGQTAPKKIPPTAFDMDKVKTTLKQFMRDWSEAGADEREACYGPVMREIKRLYSSDKCDASSVNILVPGAGLGRLAFELAKSGYSCQGNEWSLFMLFASNFVLNKCSEVNSFRLYPWVHQWTNLKHTSDQTVEIKFPDINPTDLAPNTNFSMAAGDFLEVYTDPEAWDCVATVFFIDTAHNIIAYIERIFKILKPGGHWINLEAQ